MNFRFVILLLISWILSASYFYAESQTLDRNNIESPYLLHFSDVEFTITGTSNVRDWNIVSDTMGGIIRFGPAFTFPDENSDNPTQWFNEVFLYIPNHSLESGNSIMNQTMNKSLESGTYANLEYRMTDVEVMLAGNSSDERSFIVNGVVSAVGAEYELKHKVYVRQLSEEMLRIFGNFEMNMTDLGIVPPTFMRGALTTTDTVKVDYNFKITLEKRPDP